MKKRKLLSIVMVTGLFMAFALGSGSSSSSADKAISSVQTNAVADSDNSSSSVESNNVAASTESLSVQEMVLVDQNDVKITAKEMEDSLFGPKLKILIENNSTKGLTFQVRDTSVNGYMVDTMMSADVAAGKKVNDGITFLTSELKDCGITTFADMEFKFHIFDSETWDEYLNTDAIKIETSAAATHVQEYDDSGDVIYDENGIKIVAKGISSKDSIFGPGLILYVENNSDKNFTMQARDTSVNGFMIDTIMSKDVIAGKKAIAGLTFLSSSLEENGITDITDLEFSLHIFTMEGWEEIVNTPVIKLTF